MSVWRLILKEILYRKLTFCLGVLSVVVAVGCLVGELALLRSHDARTEQIMDAKEAEAKAEMAKLEDDYRKITLKLGFNILILPKDQNLSDLYAKDYASKYMPEGYAKTLADSRIVTIQHLLPSLRQKVEWPEQQGRTIILVGVRGEVPVLQRDPKRPLLDPVPAGGAVVGYNLAKTLGLKPGDPLTLLGKAFTVSKCHPERGNKDDITMWVNLGEAQDLLLAKGMIPEKGVINEILALKCHCVGVDIGSIRQEIGKILPSTQVVEFATEAFARAAARDRAAEAAQVSLASEKANRARLRGALEGFAAILVPIVLLGCIVWIGFLAFSNARERSSEVGILRALGVQSRAIFLLFLGKSLVMGLAGASLGYVAGLVAGSVWGEAAVALFDPRMLALVLVAAPALSGLASWVPAMMAAQQDPAFVLREG